MTGYGDGGGALPDGATVLAKPFRADELQALRHQVVDAA
jgi:hypothetical protein